MKKILALAFIALTTLSACSSDDDNSSSNPDLKLVRTMTEYGGTDQEMVSTFTYDGTKLKKISYDDATYEKFTYTGDLLTKTEYYENGALSVTQTLAYDAQGKLTSVINEEMYGNETYYEKTVYTYNSDGTIATTSYDDASATEPSATGTLTLVNGNLTSNVDDTNGTGTFTFDTKNSPFKNIKGYDAIILASKEGGMNNTLTSNYGLGDAATYTYTYNEDNFPVTQTEVESGETYVTKFTY